MKVTEGHLRKVIRNILLEQEKDYAELTDTQKNIQSLQLPADKAEKRAATGRKTIKCPPGMNYTGTPGKGGHCVGQPGGSYVQTDKERLAKKPGTYTTPAKRVAKGEITSGELETIYAADPTVFEPQTAKGLEHALLPGGTDPRAPEVITQYEKTKADAVDASEFFPPSIAVPRGTMPYDVKREKKAKDQAIERRRKDLDLPLPMLTKDQLAKGTDKVQKLKGVANMTNNPNARKRAAKAEEQLTQQADRSAEMVDHHIELFSAGPKGLSTKPFWSDEELAQQVKDKASAAALEGTPAIQQIRAQQAQERADNEDMFQTAFGRPSEDDDELDDFMALQQPIPWSTPDDESQEEEVQLPPGVTFDPSIKPDPAPPAKTKRTPAQLKRIKARRSKRAASEKPKETLAQKAARMRAARAAAGSQFGKFHESRLRQAIRNVLIENPSEDPRSFIEKEMNVPIERSQRVQRIKDATTRVDYVVRPEYGVTTPEGTFEMGGESMEGSSAAIIPDEIKNKLRQGRGKAKVIDVSKTYTPKELASDEAIRAAARDKIEATHVDAADPTKEEWASLMSLEDRGLSGGSSTVGTPSWEETEYEHPDILSALSRVDKQDPRFGQPVSKDWPSVKTTKKIQPPAPAERKETLAQKAARMRAERAAAGSQFGKFHENKLRRVIRNILKENIT